MTLPPLHPCPHCGAPLAISTRTPDGERARCGSCRKTVVWICGQLTRPALRAAGDNVGLHLWRTS